MRKQMRKQMKKRQKVLQPSHNANSAYYDMERALLIKTGDNIQREIASIPYQYVSDPTEMSSNLIGRVQIQADAVVYATKDVFASLIDAQRRAELYEEVKREYLERDPEQNFENQALQMMMGIDLIGCALKELRHLDSDVYGYEGFMGLLQDNSLPSRVYDFALALYEIVRPEHVGQEVPDVENVRQVMDSCLHVYAQDDIQREIAKIPYTYTVFKNGALEGDEEETVKLTDEMVYWVKIAYVQLIDAEQRERTYETVTRYLHEKYDTASLEQFELPAGQFLVAAAASFMKSEGVTGAEDCFNRLIQISPTPEPFVDFVIALYRIVARGCGGT